MNECMNLVTIFFATNRQMQIYTFFCVRVRYVIEIYFLKKASFLHKLLKFFNSVDDDVRKLVCHKIFNRLFFRDIVCVNSVVAQRRIFSSHIEVRC